MEQTLAAIPIIDHHMHAMMRLEEPLTPERFVAFFSEGGDEAILRYHARNNLFYRRTVRELAQFLGCEPEIGPVLEARNRMAPGELARRLVADANIEIFLLDYYFQSEANYSLEEMPALLGAPVRPILRLETVLEELASVHDTLPSLLEAFQARIHEAAAGGTVALKSIIAYRTGLRVSEPELAEVERAFGELHEQALREGRIRLANKPFLDHCLRVALETAGELGLPVQLHTGFGDTDLDMREVNPLHLRPLLEDARYRRTPFVLLHAGYPYVREMGYLASVYGHVYADVSLAIPFAVSDLTAIWRQILGLAPFSKVLYASDGFSIPEHYWVGARWARQSLSTVLSELVDLGALSRQEAVEAARAVLNGNARRVYQL